MRAGVFAISSLSIAVWKTIAPSKATSREPAFSMRSLELLLSFKTIVSLCLGLTLISCVLFIPHLLLLLGYAEGPTGVVMRAVIGFNSLFIVSLFTVSTVVMVVPAVVLSRRGVISFSLDLRARLGQLATWVGYGTMAGVVVAAFAPILSAIMKQTSPPLSPSLLIELPAVGAIGGYVVGLIVLSLNLGSCSPNLLCRHLLFPALFLCVFFVIYKIGVTPEGLFQYTILEPLGSSGALSFSCSPNDVDDQIRAHGSDPRWLLAFARHCGTGALVDGGVLVGCVVVGVSVFAIFGFFQSVWRNMAPHMETVRGAKI